MHGALLGLALFCAAPAHATEKPVPAPPYYYVLDEPGVLSSSGKHAIETLLVEHTHTTGEQVVVAIFKSLDNEDLVQYTNRVFNTWKIGKSGKDNGVLLALYWQDRKARIEVGYGLEPVLTDAKSKLVLNEYLIPALQAGQTDQALASSTLQILTDLGSPLVENGKAQEILSSGGYRNDVRYAPVSAPGATRFSLLLGIIFLVIVINWLNAREAHYTGRGWYRTRARDSFWWGGGFGGSGGFGGFGGGGGFSGGGGSSGGGGASGGW